jgi:malate dehydrogenase (quinone)
VNGEWLICKKSSITKKHFSKIYGIAGPKAPPMSAPHLDLRIINGKRQLMFGPFASFTFKFLKNGLVFRFIEIDSHPKHFANAACIYLQFKSSNLSY